MGKGRDSKRDIGTRKGDEEEKMEEDYPER